MEILKSTQDPSINFIEESLTGFLESRYVRKVPEYFICYLSSQSGCNKGCRFCHLTSTKQTKFENSTSFDFYKQAVSVLEHYEKIKHPANLIHYNFMARGEALSNPYLIDQADYILGVLGNLALSYDPCLSVRFNISTILPKNLLDLGPRALVKIFKYIHPTIYYSLYSLDPNFRNKWMPSALDVETSLEMLSIYQEYSKKNIKIHHCFIENENDSESTVLEWIRLLDKFKIQWEFNLVRYNPYSAVQGKESSTKVIIRNLKLIGSLCPTKKVKVIPRVGFDVKASCGMFVDKSR